MLLQPLDIAAWCAAEEPFELQYVDLFEVHGGISIKQQLPPYSEAFRGYGLNKQQHAWHAAALGFRFTVSEGGLSCDCVGVPLTRSPPTAVRGGFLTPLIATDADAAGAA